MYQWVLRRYCAVLAASHLVALHACCSCNVNEPRLQSLTPLVGCIGALLQVKAVYMPLKDPAWR
jgi:hypothetical protein